MSRSHRSRTARRLLAVPGAALLILAVLTGCGAGDGDGGEGDAGGGESVGADVTDGGGDGADGGDELQYVALGDSYTAAPFVGETDTSDGCLRTDANYPSLVAEELDLELTDVSCGGASTADLAEPQMVGNAPVPPQLDALSEDTDIVTFSLGGNDNDYFAGLVGCAQLGASDPNGSPCRDRFGASDPAQDRALMRQSAATLTENVSAGIRAVAERAPQAQILVVGYPQFTPDEGTCPAFPVATGDLDLVRRLNILLTEAVADAAAAEDVTYVDLYAATEGHDVCADEPWVAGAEPTGPAAPYHPYAEGQEAAAAAVVEAIEGS